MLEVPTSTVLDGTIDALTAYGLNEQAIDAVLGRICRLTRTNKEDVVLELCSPQDQPPNAYEEFVRVGNCWLISREEDVRSNTLSIYRVSDDRVAAEALLAKTTKLKLTLANVGNETLTLWRVKDPETEEDRLYLTPSELVEQEGVTQAAFTLMESLDLKTEHIEVEAGDCDFACTAPYVEVECEQYHLPAAFLEAGNRAVIEWGMTQPNDRADENPFNVFWDAMCDAQAELIESGKITVDPANDLKQLLRDCQVALLKKKGAPAASKLVERLKAWIDN